MHAQVDAEQVLRVRDALLSAGDSLWKPVTFNRLSLNRRALGGDEEVNQALAQLLAGGSGWQVRSRPCPALYCRELGLMSRGHLCFSYSCQRVSGRVQVWALRDEACRRAGNMW